MILVSISLVGQPGCGGGVFCHHIPTAFPGFLIHRDWQAAGREDGLRGLQQVGSAVAGKEKPLKWK